MVMVQWQEDFNENRTWDFSDPSQVVLGTPSKRYSHHQWVWEIQLLVRTTRHNTVFGNLPPRHPPGKSSVLRSDFLTSKSISLRQFLVSRDPLWIRWDSAAQGDTSVGQQSRNVTRLTQERWCMHTFSDFAAVFFESTNAGRLGNSLNMCNWLEMNHCTRSWGWKAKSS